MSLAAGTRLGQYEILGALGAGGMGEVYRARDTKLQREVAVKVLPDLFAADPDRLARFEREARVVAALSHPNILAIHDYGRDGATTYAVMELLEGASLRARLDEAPLPARRAIDYAGQMARGLAAAHDKGIVHRDLKPDNLFVTSDGHVKILDFGLARVAAPLAAAAAAATVTGAGTEAGVVLGTVGYMSPEQVRGGTVDHRSDIFSLGAVLYEMVTGKRAFGGDSAVETMNAILKEDPPELDLPDEVVAGPLDRVIRHCLEKQPAERFQSARDLAFDLESLGTRSGQARTRAEERPRPRTRLTLPLAVGLAAAALAAGAVAGTFLRPPAQPSNADPRFTRLTYEKGTIWSGRFAPDGKTIVFGAGWDGQPVRAFLARTERAGATALTLPDASILAISSSGELAVALGYRSEGWMGEGTLARVPMFGGAPRSVVEHVRFADWTPDGSDLAIVRPVNGRERLEFPIGTPLYETSGWISHIRFSPSGQYIAFADHPVYGDDNGDVAVVDRAGKTTALVRGLVGLRGIAWSADGREILYTANNIPYAGDFIGAVALDARVRRLLAIPSNGKLLDVAKDGRLLFEGESVFWRMEARPAAAPGPIDISLYDQSFAGALSRDGRSVLIADQSSLTEATYATYLRRIDQTDAGGVRLGPGQPFDFSPDGRWAVSATFGAPSHVWLLPIGAGQARELANPEHLTIIGARWLPDGAHLVILGGRGTEPMRGWVQDIDAGTLRPFTPPGVQATRFWSLPLSPDGTRVTLVGPDGRIKSYPVAGGTPQDLPLTGREFPVEWTTDGRGLFISEGGVAPQTITRLDLDTGRREPWLTLSPSQIAGTRLSQILLTRDGRSYVHSYSQLLSDLYVVEGVR